MCGFIYLVKCQLARGSSALPSSCYLWSSCFVWITVEDVQGNDSTYSYWSNLNIGRAHTETQRQHYKNLFIPGSYTFTYTPSPLTTHTYPCTPQTHASHMVEPYFLVLRAMVNISWLARMREQELCDRGWCLFIYCMCVCGG